jgi:hypothetical protein
LTKSGFEKLGERPRNVSSPNDDPGASSSPDGKGLVRFSVDVRSPSSDVIGKVLTPKPFDAEIPTTFR